ncbi:asparagine synthase family [Oleiphilus messinensis]|uniref:asparagine synthase (glutamine-hydrolyzing) n=1 Tax=Oleiphilus messinensis TaxID=141451 RepID=A0A1Y0IF39_9GAMM|nr:asparagine synthase-related protein [Oleiphilus messinensis]ARU59157.1 asparagine synthase family [Oleiphilus messinensis]
MGALIGYFGKPEASLLAAMGKKLKHRGPLQQISRTPWGELGHLHRPVPKNCRWLVGGSYHNGDNAIALAGFLTKPENTSLPELLTAFQSEGMALFKRLRGQFLLAIMTEQALILVRDSLGNRTAFWAYHDARYYFASEPKAIWSSASLNRTLRPEALAQYLSFSFIPGAATMLQEIQELQPGHALILPHNTPPSSVSYLDYDAPRQHQSYSEAEWVRQFKAAHQAAVAERLPDRDPIAVFLSGGVDSSAVTAELSKQAPGRIHSFAIHFGRKYPNELEFARMVATHCHTIHEEVLIQPRDFLPRLRQIIWTLDNPIGDPITVPNYELAAHVARLTPWVFNGEGGDPLFGGPKNLSMLLHHWYGGIERDAGFRERNYLASYRRAYEEWQSILTPDIRREIDPKTHLEDVIGDYLNRPKPGTFLNKLMLLNTQLKGAHLILPKVEAMTGAHQITALSPLFDQRLAELSFAMPPTLKLQGGVEKIVLKRAYEPYLPARIIKRPKSGMRVPVHYWFQKEMRRYTQKILSKKSLDQAGIFDPKRVKQILDYDLDDRKGRYGIRLWMLLTFEIWRRLTIEGEPL